jgi:hypothetical protein
MRRTDDGTRRAGIGHHRLLLTDPQSTFLTGAVLPVDGGWTSHPAKPAKT